MIVNNVRNNGVNSQQQHQQQQGLNNNHSNNVIGRQPRQANNVHGNYPNQQHGTNPMQQQRHHNAHGQHPGRNVSSGPQSGPNAMNRAQNRNPHQQPHQGHNSHSQQQHRSSSQGIQGAHQARQPHHGQQHHSASQHSSRPTAAPNANPNQNNTMPNGPPLPNVLPKGWKKEEIVRTKGITSGLVDVVYVPNPAATELAGRKFRSKLELQRFFGTKYDMSLLDYKSGKLSQVAWRKQRRIKSLAANNTNYVSAAKYDNYLNLPIRQTASIFKQSVSCITNNHKNEPTPASVLNPPAAAATKTTDKPKPVQLFWELRFNNLRAVDSKLLNQENANINQDLQLNNIPKFKNFAITNETVLRSVAASWYLNQTKPLLGQEKEFSKNARIFIDREQPLIPQLSVKEAEIKLQESRVKEIRKQMQAALDELENVDCLNMETIDGVKEEVAKQEMDDQSLNMILV